MSYCIYLRKSRADAEAEARGEGETLARHKKLLTELGERQKLNISKIYSEIVSGDTIAARPVMQRLLSDVENNLWDGVLVMEVERLARGNTIDQGIVAQTFKLSGTKIITPMKTYDPNNEYDEEYFEFGLFMSRREYKTINRRLQRGRAASVKEGKYVGNKAPYGYSRIKLENDKGYTLEPNPQQAPIVKMIFEFYTKGELGRDGSFENMGVSKIVQKLNELKIPTVSGCAWVSSTVQGILHNPVYIGKIRWNARPTRQKMIDGQAVKERPRAKAEDWILANGLHEPLIDNHTWESAQSRLSENTAHTAPKNHVTMNPLAGLIICGKCGQKMVRRPYDNYPDTLLCTAASCDNISTSLSCVEDRILEALRQWLENYEFSYKKMPKGSLTDTKKEALMTARDKISALEKQRDKICGLLEQGVYSTDVFLKRQKNIEAKINEAKGSIVKISEDIESEERAEAGRKIIVPKAENVLSQYRNASTAAEKNELLKSVIEKAVYTKTVNGRWHGSPDDFELIIYPKLAE